MIPPSTIDVDGRVIYLLWHNQATIPEMAYQVDGKWHSARGSSLAWETADDLDYLRHIIRQDLKRGS